MLLIADEVQSGMGARAGCSRSSTPACSRRHRDCQGHRLGLLLGVAAAAPPSWMRGRQARMPARSAQPGVVRGRAGGLGLLTDRPMANAADVGAHLQAGLAGPRRNTRSSAM
jgi:hypothetical protein